MAAHVPLTGWKDVKINPNLFEEKDMDGFVCFQELSEYDVSTLGTAKDLSVKGQGKKKKSKKALSDGKKTILTPKAMPDKEVTPSSSDSSDSKLSRKDLKKLKWKEKMIEKNKKKKQRKLEKTSQDTEAGETDKSAIKDKQANVKNTKKAKGKKKQELQQNCDPDSISKSESELTKPNSDSDNQHTINTKSSDDSLVRKLESSGKSGPSNQNAKKGKKAKHKKEAVKLGRIVDSQAVEDISMAETSSTAAHQGKETKIGSKKRKEASQNQKEKTTKRKTQDKMEQSSPTKKSKVDKGGKTDTEPTSAPANKANADMSAWKDLFVPEPVLRALSEQGFTTPTPIQVLSLPSAIRDHKDIVGAAETGSGKTLSFGIPIIHNILKHKASMAEADLPSDAEDMNSDISEDAEDTNSDTSDEDMSDLEWETESEDVSDTEGQMDDLENRTGEKSNEALESSETGDEKSDLFDVIPTKEVCVVDMEASTSSQKGLSSLVKKSSKSHKLEAKSGKDGADSDIIDASDNNLDDGVVQDDDSDNDDDSDDDDDGDERGSDSDEGSVQDLSADAIAMATDGLEDEFSDGEYDLPPDEEDLGDVAEGDMGCVAVVNDVEFDWLQEEKVKKTKPKPTGKDKPLYALIITPTRELAVQVKNHLEAAAKYTDIKVCVVVGGMASQKQERMLKKQPEIVVATPGRLWELHQQGEPHLNKLEDVQHLVIDEADRMVEKGHFQELSQLLELINGDDKKKSKRQNFVFSATLTLVHSGPQRLILKKKKFKMDTKQKVDSLMGQVGLHEKAKVIDLSKKQGTAESLTEARINCSQEEKDLYLYYFMRVYPGRTLVFVNSKDCLRRLVSVFTLLQCKPLPLHSDMQQRQRLKNLDKFRDLNQSLLIATDVAARGLDIPNVEHVIHFQVPRTTENYVHRSGRTARATKEGLSIMFIGPDDLKSYRRIIHTLNRDEDLPMFPTEGDALTALKPRVTLARQIDKEEHVVTKKKKENSWFTKAAEEMDIELDEDQLLYDLGDQYSQTMEKNKMGSMREELKYLIKIPMMQRSGSGKYPTKSGKLVIPYMSGVDHAKGAVNAMKSEKKLTPKQSNMENTIKMGKRSKKKFKKKKK